MASLPFVLKIQEVKNHKLIEEIEKKTFVKDCVMCNNGSERNVCQGKCIKKKSIKYIIKCEVYSKSIWPLFFLQK